MKVWFDYPKSVKLVNELLKSGIVKNDGNWILTCDAKDKERVQDLMENILKNTMYKGYKVTFFTY